MSVCCTSNNSMLSPLLSPLQCFSPITVVFTFCIILCDFTGRKWYCFSFRWQVMFTGVFCWFQTISEILKANHSNYWDYVVCRLLVVQYFRHLLSTNLSYRMQSVKTAHQQYSHHRCPYVEITVIKQLWPLFSSSSSSDISKCYFHILVYFTGCQIFATWVHI